MRISLDILCNARYVCTVYSAVPPPCPGIFILFQIDIDNCQQDLRKLEINATAATAEGSRWAVCNGINTYQEHDITKEHRNGKGMKEGGGLGGNRMGQEKIYNGKQPPGYQLVLRK